MNFFVAALGRSGTNWLQQLLNRSEVYTVGHEECDGRAPGYIHAYSPFPIERFARPHYGEVHGFLRYHLSAGFTGSEILVPNRALVTRDTFDLIRSWMQCGQKEDWEFSAIAFEVILQQRLLQDWANRDVGVRQVKFEDLTGDLEVLAGFCEWLGVGVVPTKDDLINKVGQSNGDFKWTQELVDRVHKIAKRQGATINEFTGNV